MSTTQVDNTHNGTSDQLGRRSRFRRQSSGRRVVLGPRDLEILSGLYRYRHLRRTHLVTLLQPKSEKRLTERLGQLFHETGLINRPNLQPGMFDARSAPMLYEITQKGIDLLDAHKALPHRAVTSSRRGQRAFSPQFLHTMLIIETLLAIECETRAKPEQRFVPVDEILARAPDETRNACNPLAIPITLVPSAQHPIIRKRKQTALIPDGLYGIEYLINGAKRYRFWALECERTSPAWRSKSGASSTALKKAAYDALIDSRAYQNQWGIPNLKLNLVTQRDITLP